MALTELAPVDPTGVVSQFRLSRPNYRANLAGSFHGSPLGRGLMGVVSAQSIATGSGCERQNGMIRRHSQAACAEVKKRGAKNELLDCLAKDPAFATVDLAATIDASQFICHAQEQVDEFVVEVVDPIRQRYAVARSQQADVHV
jgi:hypothetical protein